TRATHIPTRRSSDLLPIVGLRYFNVFGPRESHKGRAASMIYHLYHQMKAGRRPRLFHDGGQTRDFLYVRDAVNACIRALHAPSRSEEHTSELQSREN